MKDKPMVRAARFVRDLDELLDRIRAKEGQPEWPPRANLKGERHTQPIVEDEE